MLEDASWLSLSSLGFDGTNTNELPVSLAVAAVLIEENLDHELLLLVVWLKSEEIPIDPDFKIVALPKVKAPLLNALS